MKLKLVRWNWRWRVWGFAFYIDDGNPYFALGIAHDTWALYLFRRPYLIRYPK